MLLKPFVKIKKLYPDAKLPQHAKPFDSGADLCAYLPDGFRGTIPNMTYWLNPGERRLIMTGIAIELPEGFEAQVRCRSGLALKSGLMVVNGVGTIDHSYRGEIGVILLNSTKDQAFEVKQGDRIAQLVIAPVAYPTFMLVDELSETDRASGSFGSTGV